jgi:protein-disulfide isomerase
MPTPHAPQILAATLILSLLAPLAAQRAVDTGAAARVGERAITLDEVDRVAMVQDSGRFRGLRLRDAIYEARRSALEVLIADRLIEADATRAGVTPAALLELEVTRSLVPVTPQDVEAWYQANQSRVGGSPLEQIAEKIQQALEQQRREEAKARYVARLRAATGVTVLLTPPREAIEIAENEPSAGPANAPVQIVMYSDFQCPFCARVGPTLNKVQQRYGDRVRVVFRDFPLNSIHPRATAAAVAARCAHEQGRFWAYHDRLFASANRLEDRDFTEYATDLGLDVPRFTACVQDNRPAATVTGSVKSGERLGVSATPAFFINGRFLPGAQPFEAFQRVIEDELKSSPF